MTRIEMMQAIIEKFGFESAETIVFCVIADTPSNDDEQVRKIYEEFMSW